MVKDESTEDEIATKSRKVKFFTLTHGVTLSTSAANLKKHKGQHHKNSALLLAVSSFLILCIINEILKIPTKNKGLVKDKSPEQKVSNPQN